MASLRTLCKMRFKKNTIRIDFRDNQTKKNRSQTKKNMHEAQKGHMSLASPSTPRRGKFEQKKKIFKDIIYKNFPELKI